MKLKMSQIQLERIVNNDKPKKVDPDLIIPSTDSELRLGWAHSIYVSSTKYSTLDMHFSISQRSLLGILYFRKWREEVIYNDKSLLVMGEGRHRSAKSTTWVTIACLMDKTFWKYFEHRIVQTPREFMSALDVIEKEGIKGAVIVVDEAGVSMDSGSWYEEWMKCLEKTVMVFGFLNPIIFFCAPQKDFISSKLRKMAHYYAKFARYNKMETTVKIYDMEWNTILKDYVYRKPDVSLFGQRIRIRKFYITKPPQIIIDRYKALERKRKPIIINELSKDIERSETARKLSANDLKGLIDDVAANYERFASRITKDGFVILDVNIIAYNLKVDEQVAKKIKSMAQTKVNADKQEAKRAAAKMKEEELEGGETSANIEEEDKTESAEEKRRKNRIRAMRRNQGE